MNEKHPDSERQPDKIIPTHGPPPPPPPGRAPTPSNPDEEPATPATQRMASPAHAPSQRPGGRVVIRRKDSPPEGTPKIIDRQRGAARAHGGIHSAGLAGVHLYD